MKLKNKYEVKLQSVVFNTFRTKLACDSLDIDIAKKSTHNLTINDIDTSGDWNIGLIVGSSGSGKTTLAKKIFGENCFKTIIQENTPIIEQLPEELGYHECAKILSGIGLTSVPCWVRPVYTLSNGQKARAEAALQMVKNKDIAIIDEWTSVVDRQIAKIMSHCIAKFSRKNDKKIILCSCHYDILEWLNPDWIIDCNDQKFIKNDIKKKGKKPSNLQSKKSTKIPGDILASIII